MYDGRLLDIKRLHKLLPVLVAQADNGLWADVSMRGNVNVLDVNIGISDTGWCHYVMLCCCEMSLRDAVRCHHQMRGSVIKR